jgi:hypothetical protein
VVTIDDNDDAEKALSGMQFDLVVLMPQRGKDTHAGFSAAAKWIQTIQSERGDYTRVFDSMKVLPDWMPEGVVRIAAPLMNAEVLREGMRMALARKRSPRKLQANLRKAA